MTVRIKRKDKEMRNDYEREHLRMGKVGKEAPFDKRREVGTILLDIR